MSLNRYEVCASHEVRPNVVRLYGLRLWVSSCAKLFSVSPRGTPHRHCISARHPWFGWREPWGDAARAILVLFAVALAAPARGQVSCADPNNLCTGDPCRIGYIEVQSPCIVDFGARRVIISGGVGVPEAGTLSFMAGAFELRRGINGQHAGKGERGANISLSATGDIFVLPRARVTASGNLTAGTIALNAGGNIDLQGILRSVAVGHAPATSGGIVQVEAGGTLISSRAGRVDVYSRKATGGGQATLKGALGVSLLRPISASGSFGGAVEVSSTGGHVTVSDDLDALGSLGNGGSILVSGTGGVTVYHLDARGRTNGGSIQVSGTGGVTVSGIDAKSTHDGNGGSILVSGTGGDVTVSDYLDAKGDTNGGSIQVSSTGGDVTVSGINVNSGHGNGGTIQVSGTGGVAVNYNLDASGRTNGGSIQVSGTGGVTVNYNLYASGYTNGGSILVSSTGGVTVSHLYASGGTNGGSIQVSSTGGDVTVRGIKVKSGHGNGGTIQVSGTGGVTVNHYLDASGDTNGGSIQVSGTGGVTVSGDINVGSNFGYGGTILVSSTGGVTVNKSLEAKGGTNGGSIQVSSTGGDVTISGDLRARGSDGMGGMVNVAAMGTLSIRSSAASWSHIYAYGSTGGGRIDLTGSAVTIGSRRLLDARGGSGVIEGQASGDLTAAGDFRAAPDGCIGLSAGGTRDTTGARFDVPLMESCP